MGVTGMPQSDAWWLGQREGLRVQKNGFDARIEGFQTIPFPLAWKPNHECRVRSGIRQEFFGG
jgi:hypothetical protein